MFDYITFVTGWAVVILLNYCIKLHWAARNTSFLMHIMLITSSLKAPSTELRKVKHQCTRTFGDIASGSQLKLCVGLGQRGLNDFIEAQAFLRSYEPIPPPSPVSKLSLFLSLPLCRRPSLYWQERAGVEPDQSYDRKKAWASINRSILSGLWAHGIVAVAFAINLKEQLRTAYNPRGLRHRKVGCFPH